MSLQFGIPSTKLNIILIYFCFFLFFSTKEFSQFHNRAPPRRVHHPLVRLGPPVDLQFSNLSVTTHETRDVFSSRQV